MIFQTWKLIQFRLHYKYSFNKSPLVRNGKGLGVMGLR